MAWVSAAVSSSSAANLPLPWIQQPGSSTNSVYTSTDGFTNQALRIARCTAIRKYLRSAFEGPASARLQPIVPFMYGQAARANLCASGFLYQPT